jgi:hypothetical protein
MIRTSGDVRGGGGGGGGGGRDTDRGRGWDWPSGGAEGAPVDSYPWPFLVTFSVARRRGSARKKGGPGHARATGVATPRQVPRRSSAGSAHCVGKLGRLYRSAATHRDQLPRARVPPPPGVAPDRRVHLPPGSPPPPARAGAGRALGYIRAGFSHLSRTSPAPLPHLSRTSPTSRRARAFQLPDCLTFLNNK